MEPFYLLLESGDYLLLSTGFYLVTEQVRTNFPSTVMFGSDGGEGIKFKRKFSNIQQKEKEVDRLRMELLKRSL